MRPKPHPGGRSGRPVRPLVLAFAAILLTPTAPALALVPSNVIPSMVGSLASELVQRAVDSLEAGGGPARGAPASCMGVTSNEPTCAFGPPPTVNYSWTELSSAGGPSPRDQMAMTYDPTDGEVVAFGGCGYNCTMGETWVYSNSTWTNLTGKTGHAPSGRTNPSMTYDYLDGYVLLFGGINQTGFLQDTWGFVENQWVRLFPGEVGAVPPARFGASLTYDVSDGYVLMFGGGGFFEGRTVLNDTWSYAGGKWTEVCLRCLPTGRLDASMAYNAAQGTVILFGGELYGNVAGDTWSYHAGVWTQLHPNAAPPRREGAVMVYDTALGELVLFGGFGKTGFYSDTWALGNGTWHRVNVSGPPARSFAAAAYLPGPAEVVVFGGWDLSALYGDYWAFT